MTFKVGGKIDRDLGWQLRWPRIRWVGYRDFTLWIHSAGIHTSSRVSFITGYSNVTVAIKSLTFLPKPMYLMNCDIMTKKKNVTFWDTCNDFPWWNLLMFMFRKLIKRKPTNDLNSTEASTFCPKSLSYNFHLPRFPRWEQINDLRQIFNRLPATFVAPSLFRLKSSKVFLEYFQSF